MQDFKNMAKRLVALALALVLMSSLVPDLRLVTRAEAAYQTRCGIYADWKPFETKALTEGGRYYLTGDVTLRGRYELKGDLYLDLNGYTISFRGNPNVSAIDIYDSYRWFYLYDSVGGGTIQKTKYQYDNDFVMQKTKYDRFVYLNANGGRFVMNGGTIKGFNASVDGGAVCVDQGTFEMNGGTITGCGKVDYVGGAVYVNGSNSKFNMYGGTIGGTITGNSATHGGGVALRNQGTFNMYGGTITGNNASCDGGGVYAVDSTVNVYGGKIENNTAGWTGGGIGGCGNKCSINVSGGEICNNRNTSTSDSGYGGGGIGVWDKSRVTVSGSAKIYGNKANRGGGIIMLNSSLTVKGGELGLNEATNAKANGGYKGVYCYDGGTANYDGGGKYHYYANNDGYSPALPTQAFTVTLNKNGGTGGTAWVSLKFNQTITDNISALPLRTGYDFDGYWTTASGGDKYYDKDGKPVTSINWPYTGNQTLYAHWKPTYTITYDAAGGIGAPAKQEVRFGDSVTLSGNEPTKTGYTFKNWNTKLDGSGTTYTPGKYVNTNMTDTSHPAVTLYAQWEPNTYKLELYSNDDTYGVNGEAGFITVKPENGFKDSADQQVGSEMHPGSTDDELTDKGALWMTYGTMTLPSAEELGLTRNHYDFVGWNIYDGQDWSMYQPGTEYKVGLSSDPYGTARLYAAWKMKDFFTITYNANGGQGGPSQEARFDGDTFNLPPKTKNPTRAGYTFMGWWTSPNGKSTGVASPTSFIEPGAQYGPVTGNVTFYAQWEANKTVSFNANGGVFAEAPVVLAPAQGETVTGLFNNIPERTGYNFVGWSETKNGEIAVDPDGTDTFVMGENAVTLFAVWEKKNYPVSFVGGNADLATSTQLGVDYNEKLEFTVTVNLEQHNPDNLQVTVNGAQVAIPMPDPDTSGKIQTYKFTVNNVTEAQEVAISGVSARTYPLTLYPEGGTNAQSDLTSYYYGQALVLPTATDLTRTGYTFNGWYTAKNGGAKVEMMPADATGAKAYYAHWTANSYTIKYHANGGDGSVEDKSATYGTTVTLADKGSMTFGSENEFLGWSTDKNALTPMYQVGQKVKNLTAEANGEVILYAVWRLPAASMTTLTYDGNGVAAMDLGARSVRKNSQVTLEFPETEIVYQGKQFAGWSDGNSTYTKDGTPFTIGDGPVVLYAKWTDVSESKYTVIYYYDSETEYASQTDILFGTAVMLATITDIGEGDTTLLGWSKDSEATVPEYLPGASVTGLASKVGETVKLYAVLGENTRTFVTFDANGGQWSDGSTVKTVERATGTSLPETPTRPGYVFAEWKTGIDSGSKINSVNDPILVAGNRTVYAQWEPKTEYTVTYHHGGETATVTALMGSPTTLSYPSQFGKEDGKEFKGWATVENGDVEYLDGQTITYPSQATLDLYAVWKGTEYYLTYDDNGGTGGPGTVIVYKDARVSLSSKEPVYEGHKFNGWASGTSLLPTNTELTITGNMTLLASWTELDECRVTYDANGGFGAPVDTEPHYQGETVSILYDPQPGKTGYTFDGWKFGDMVYNQPTNTKIQLSTNTNFVAQWEPNTYSICFDPGVASQTNISKTMASMTNISYGSATKLNPNEFAAPEGKEFAGWSFTVDGKPIYEDRATVTNLTAEANGVVTLYAAWKDGAYTITLRNHSPLASDTTMSEKVVKGQPLPTPDEAPTRKGYTFAGYYSGYDAEKGTVTGEQYYDAALNGLKLFDRTTNTDLHAKWIPQTLRVIYMQDGKEISKDIVTYDQNYTFSNRALDGTVIRGVTKLAGWSENEEPLKVKYDAKGVLTKDKVNDLWDTPNNGNDLTLFAVLKDDTKYTVTYNANGGVGFPVDENGYTEGEDAKIVCTGTDLPTKANYEFQGWAETPNATTVLFAVGEEDAKLTIKKNHILYAVWKPIDYTVTFHANGGQASNSDLATKTVLVTYDSESKASLLPADTFTRDGYTLVAWARDAKGTVVVGLPGDSMSQTMTGGKACTLYAVWSADECTVTFDENYTAGGVAVATDTTIYAYDAKLGTLPKPEREGYKFEGWYKDANCTEGKKVDKTTPVKDVVSANTLKGTLYAKWSPKDYVINFSSDCGATASYTDALEKNVIGKSVAPYGTTVRFKVDYKTNKYTGVTVSYNDRPLEATGTDKHYEFTVETENTLRVEATGYNYTIVYHSDYAGTTPTTYEQKTNSTNLVKQYLASETTFTRSGYDLTGWATRSGGQIAYDPSQAITDALTTVPGGTVNLYAVWMAQPSKITFMDGTATVTSFSRGYDDALGTLPTVSKDGYQFEDWTYTASGTTMAVDGNTKVSEILAEQHKNPESPITLNAKWSPRDYAISVSSDCGAKVQYTSGNVSTLTTWFGKDKAPYGATVTFKVDYDTDKYTGVKVYHNGDKLTATGTDMHYEFTVETENELRIEATGYQYTIVYHSNYTDSTATDIVTALSTDTNLKLASATTFTRSGYKLTGWATRASGSLAYEVGETADRPLTERPGDKVNLYAVWNAVDCKVTFNENYKAANGSTPTDITTYAYDAKLGTLPTPERDGYQFEGWYTNAGDKVTKSTLVSTVVDASTLEGTLYAKWSVSDCTINVSTNCGAKVQYTSGKVSTPTTGFGKTKAPYGTTVQFKVDYDTDKYTGVAVSYNDRTLTATGTDMHYEFTVETENELRIEATGYKYTIVYHSNYNGSTATDIEVTAFSTDTNLQLASETTFNREGYKLTGWATRAIGAAEFEPGEVTSKPLTTEPGDTVNLYAKWQDMTCIITLYYKDGTNKSGTYEYDYSKLLGTLPVPTKEGYRFDGWYESPNPAAGDNPVDSDTEVKALNLSSNVTGKLVGDLYAHWTPNPYPVKVETNCGAVCATGTDATATNLNGKSLLYDSVQTFKVTYDTDKYTGVTVKYNGKELKASGTDYTFMVSTENVITVDYADYKYTVIYDANGGTGARATQTAYGSKELTLYKATETTFEKTGYEIVGWTENVQGGVRYGLGDTITTPLCTEPGGEKALYAVWMSQPSKITFWTENKEDRKYDYVDTYTLDYTDQLGELPVVTRDGYTFDGWYVGTDTNIKVTKGTKVSDIVSEAKDPVDLYAKWKAAACTITIESDCGATFKEYTETQSMMLAAASDTPHVDRAPYGSTYKFTIDYDTALYPSVTVKVNNVVVEPGANGVYTIESVDTVNVITVTADAYYYHVTYNANGGTATPTDVATKTTLTSLATNTNVLAGPIFERTGYTMAGWALTKNGDVVYGFEQHITAPLTSNAGDNVNLYAVWHADYNKATIEGYTDTYDGINHILSVKITPHEEWLSNITYQWYKNGHLLNGATQRDFKVKNVADSGEYYCVVKATEIETGSSKQYTTEPVEVKIERKVATVTALDRSVVYGNDLPTFAFNYDGFVAGETKSVITGTPTVTTESYAAGTGVGTYTDIVKVNTTDNSGETVVAGISADNYTFVAGDPATLTVTPRPLTVKWNRTTFFYTGFAHTVTAEPTNLFGNDEVELTYGGVQRETRPGDYVVKVVGCDSENYMIPGGEISHNWSIGRWAEGDETPMTDIAILPNTLDLVVGETEEITATVGLESLLSSPVTWTSSDETIVKVASYSNLTATVTAVDAGTAEITVTTGEGYSASCFVTVTEEIPASATDLRLSKQTAIITTHEGTVDLNISLIGFDANTMKIVAGSSDDMVATTEIIDNRVLRITADDNGTATIKVEMVSRATPTVIHASDTCDVTVFVSDTKVVESVKETFTGYVIYYTDGTTKELNKTRSVEFDLDFDALISPNGLKSTFDELSSFFDKLTEKRLAAKRAQSDSQTESDSSQVESGSSWIESSGSTESTEAPIVYGGGSGRDGVGIVSIEKTGSKDNMDTYTISYSDGTTSTFIVTNGVDGHTPVITIGDNGNWFIDGVDTGKVAVPKTANTLSIVAISSSGITLAGLIYLLFRNRKLEALLMGKKK